MFFAKQHHKKGFTLAETILVVAIIAILLAVAAPNVLAYYRQLKLTGLDDDAKTIFMAAQSRLTAMLSAGEELKPSGTPTGSFGTGSYTETPAAGGAAGGAGDPTVNFWFVANDYSGLHNYVPAGSIETQLQNNKFVVEFNPDTGAVYAVWYWENDNNNFTYKSNYYKTDIERDTRLDEMVGYYGGSEVKRPELGQMPIPQLSLINAEELRLDIKLPLDGMTASDFGNSNIRVAVTISDSEGHEKTIIKGAGLDGSLDANNPEGSLVLDTLKPNSYKKGITTDGDKLEGIGDKFKEWVKDSDITPGDDINVTVVVSYVGTVTIDSKETSLVAQSASVSTNSLFAGLEGGNTALIAYGRHLQNLHDSGLSSEFCSGVLDNSNITSAKQIRDINFASVNPDTYNIANPDPAKIANDIYYWGSTYPDLSENPDNRQDQILDFNAISNTNLTAYDGKHYEIRNMHIVEAGGFGGLFASVIRGDYDNITMVNPHVHVEPALSGTTGGSAGAIIGFAGGEVKIDGCKVYSEYDSTKDLSVLENLLQQTLDNTKIEATSNGGCFVSALLGVPHIEGAESGSSAGGLVGWSNENISINNSFSSIPVVGQKNAGGLVGLASDISINNSYSASFVYGDGYVSGLVGFAGNAGDNVVIENCYAAGEIMNGNPSSFVGAGLGSFHADANKDGVVNNYSAVKFVNATGAAKTNGGEKQGSVYGTYSGDESGKNYYIADPDVTEGYGNQEGGGTAKCGDKVSAADLIEKFESNPAWTTAVAEMAKAGTKLAEGDNTKFTHPYNLLDGMNLQVYPYPMLTTKIDVYENSGTTPTKTDLPMEHYGDWVVGASGEPAAAYIEMYADSGSGDKRFGVYAARMNADGDISGTIYKSLLDGEVVLDDFYRFLSPSVLTSATVALDNGTAGALELDTSFSADGKIKDVKGNEFYVYKLNNDPGLKNYYHKIEIVIGSETKTYLYNPYFACEAFDVTERLAGGNTVNEAEKLQKLGYNDFVRSDVTVNETDVYIRSARQLANIQAYTQNTESAISEVSQKWVYDQLADIDFNAYTGTGLTVGRVTGTRLTPAKLTSGEYYGHEYTISNLYIGKGTTATYAGLFESVGGSGSSDGKLDGMRLVNVDVDGGDATATGGLVGVLYGSVEDCGIYVSGAGEYSNWIIKGTGSNGVGGLIGDIASSNGNGAKTSFASVKVDGTGGAVGTGTGPVGGFAGQIAAGGTVEDCYAGGFIDASTKTYLATSANVTGGGNVGGFVGTAADGSIFTGVNYSTASVKGTDHDKLGLFAGNMNKPTTAGDRLLNAVAKAFVGTGEVAPRDESDYMGVSGNVTPETTVTTEVYNQDPDAVFPYPSGQKVHHGDWIVVEVMGLYHDTVNGTTGYYANGNIVNGTIGGVDMAPLVTGTPGDKNYASDDGYMFVSKEDLGEKLKIKIGGNSYELSRTNISTNPIKINDTTYEYEYDVPADALNAATTNYYTAISINGKIFYANFGVACEIFDSSRGQPNKPWAKSGIKYNSVTVDASGNKTYTPEELKDYTGVVVRSARQLANIGIRSNMGEYNALNTKVYTPAAEAIQTAAISQVLDIDYSKYTTTKIPKAAVLDGSNTNANHTPITINAGSYDGHEYEIRNLVPGMIRQVSGVSGTSVTEALIESGLVGRITEGEIKNVTLINATVVNNAGKVTENGTGGSNVAHTLKGSDLSSGQYTGSLSYTSKGMIFNVYFNGTTSVSNDKVENGSQKTWSDGKKYSQYIRFGGAGSTDGTNTKRAVEFTTSYPATIKVWWVRSSADEARQLGIYREHINDSNLIKKSSGKTETSEILECETTEPGKYYITSTSARTDIYAIEVTEHVPATILGGLDPDGSTFPDALITTYKTRFGALLGVSLANPTDTADETVVIDNCGAYVVPVDATGNVITSPTTEKYTDSYNKFAVKNTGASTADAVGGLIGMAGDGASIKSSYAAVKVEGNNIVGGFIGHLKNSTIQNCYSGGHTIKGMYSTTDYNVTAKDTDEGFAGGFAGQIENSGDADNLKFVGVNYSTSSAKGGAKAGNFAGNIVDANKNWSGFNSATVYGVGATLAPKYTDERAYLDSTMTLHAYDYGNDNAAEPYDMDVLGSYYYPYEVPADTVHHGDWPMRYNIIYYELYKDPMGDYTDSFGNTLKNRDVKLDHANDATEMGAEYIGFYGKIPRTGGTSSTAYDIINTLRVSGTVYDSGYMIVSNANVDSMLLAINSHYVDNEDKDAAEKELGNRNYYDENPDVPRPLHTTTLRTAVKLDFTEATGYKIKNENDTNETPAGKLLGGNYGYVIPAEGLLLPAASDEFYMETQINGQTYLFNPQFPCEAVNVGIDKTLSDGTREINYSEIRDKEGINYVWIDENGEHLETDKKIEDTLIIRSPLNLAGFVRYSRQSSTGLVKDKIIKYKFEQHMDVDYGSYVKKVYDGYSNNRTQIKHADNPSLVDEKDKDELNNKVYKDYVTGTKDHGQVPGLLDGGQYNGRNHKISNLWLACDSDDSTKIGLFGELRGGAVVQNVQMENIHLQRNRELASKDKDYKTSVGALAAMVHDATIKNVTINNVSIDAGDDVSSSDKRPKFEAIGGAVGKIGKIETARTKLDEPEKVEVSNVTVIDPTIKVSIKYNTSKDVKVGGVIGSADGKTFDYSSAVTGTDTRSVTITDTGVYMSETNKGKFNDMGVKASGDKLSNDYSGGFAGYLGKGVNVTKDYAAIRVQGKTYAGGFAGQIEGSHVESCYSGGYLDPTSATPGEYSTSEYNVTTGSSGTSGGFAGKIDLAKSGSGMALYMTGHNYTTSSVGGETRGQFAGEFSNDDLEALNKKMGAKAPVLYAVGKVKDADTNKLTGVYTGSATPRGTNTFEAVPYYDALGKVFPYATDLTQHHGDWVKVDLNAVGYWEVENGLLRLWYIPADAPDEPVEMLESGAAIGFDHDSRDAMGITASGYFVVSSNKSTTFSTGMTKLTDDTAEKITKLLGGDSVAIEVYALNNGKSDNQTWTVNGAEFTVNPAYGMAIEHGATSTMGASADEAYQIRTVGQLENMGGVSGNVYFQQTHDIVCDDSFNSVKDFGGYFDGGFYRIIDNTKPVFDELKGATVDNVIVYAPQGDKTIAGNGGLAASTSGTVEIKNTIVAGFTIKPNSGNVGGLVGEVTGGSLTIKNSEATNTLTGGSSSNVGGLVGNVTGSNTVEVTNSYAGGYIKKEGSTKVATAGGLVGFASTPENVSYENVYSYVNMMDASADTYYGIGPGKVNTDSVISDYWATGLDGKTAKDSDANIKGVTLAEMKLHTQAMDGKPDSVTVEEYLKPDKDVRSKGLENLAEGKAEAEKFGVFPFAAFVTGKDTNYHYGDYPEAQYAGLYYYEKEVIFDAEHQMTTDTTTGKITNEAEARTEYNYYAYGGEIYNGKLYGQRVLDTLCYDHHLTGEYAYIAESGYGYFYPGAAGAYKATVKDLKNEKDITDHTETLLSTSDQIREHLLEAFDVTSGADFQVYRMVTTGGYIAETWTLSPTDTTVSGEVVMKVNTAFGGAIADKFGNDGLGADKLEGEPVQVRTMQQFQNLTTVSGVDDSLEHFAITHDLNGRGFVDANTPGATGYVVGKDNAPHCNILEGKGYRILDLNIKAESGDVALFSKWKNSDNSLLSGVILYSTDGKGEISTKNGNAAGLVVDMGRNMKDCVVSGYTISGTKYVGGLAAMLNTTSGRKVEDCQAIVTLKHTGISASDAGIGGITGNIRSSLVENCYVGGAITVNNDGVPVGGIFGTGSSPTLKKCYSFMDLRSTGAKVANVYAIGKGGTITDCYYLTEYATGATVDTTQGTGQTFEQLCNQRTDDTKKADYVYVPNGTDPIDGITSWGDAYPMAAVVKVGVHAGVDTGVDKTGEVLVHYGEWPYCARAAGIAYWEKDDGEYKIQIVGADFYGKALYKEANTKTLYGDELCEERHVDASGKIEEHNITDSGYAVFTTNSALAVDATGLPTTEASSDKSGVVAAINKALGGACLSGETKVYSNNDVDTGSVKTATVKHDDTEVAGVTLNYNPGMSGVSYDTFGTTANPVPIRTVRQLDDIPSNGTSGRNFKQTHDLYGKDYMSGGKAKYTGAENFAGKYNGQSYKILDLSMNGDKKNVGLFASTDNATLNNIILYSRDGSASIRGTGQGSAKNYYYGVGGIVGNLYSNENNKIINCVVAGYIISGEDYVGGIVGYAFHGGTIANCASVNTIHGSVTENGTTTYANGVGGVVGGGDNYDSYAVKIYDCYAGGTIEECGTSKVVGGVYGRNDNSGSLTIKNCYVYVNMSGCSTANVYTISGDTSGSISNSYYLNDLNRYPTGSEIQGTPISYNDLTDSSKWGERFPDIADIDFEVKPDKATSSYVTHNKDAGDKDKKSDDGWTPVEKQTTTLPGFPFPEVAYKVDKDGKPDGYVHYGEWPATNTATTPTTPSKNPGKIGVFMGFDSDTTFDSSSDAVAYMFDENGMRYRLGTSNKGTTCSYLGLVIGGVEPTDSKLSGLQVIYFADGVEYDSGSLKGTVTSFHDFNSATAVAATSKNSSQFGSYKLYQVSNDTIKTDTGAVVIAIGANVSAKGSNTIDKSNVVGWFALKDLQKGREKTPYTGINIPKGASLNGVMSAAVPEGLMPEASALPVNELAGEPVEEGETGEILPPDTPEEVTPEASALPVNELAGEPVEGGETEEILPPDTPDAIKPEEFTLPEDEDTDDNGDDGHTEIIDIRVSVARVRRVR